MHNDILTVRIYDPLHRKGQFDSYLQAASLQQNCVSLWISIDIWLDAGEGGEACTMLVRTLHWVVPSYSIWGLPFFLFYSTRLAQFLYERPNQGMLRSLLCRLMTPLVSFFFYLSLLCDTKIHVNIRVSLFRAHGRRDLFCSR
jgi:hypothetical protein